MVGGLRTVLLILVVFAALGGCSANTAARSSETGVVAETPFLFTKTQIVLAVRIAGAGPYNVLVDTGVDPSVIDLELARSLRLPLDSLGRTSGSGGGSGAVSVFPSQMRRVQIDGFEIDSIDAVAVNLAGLSKRLGMPLHGILGYSFFKGRIVEIDYPRRMMRLHDAAVPKRPRAVTMSFVLRPNDIIPLVPINVNGSSATVSLDTGSGRVLEIYPEAIDKLRLASALAVAQPIELMGARGEFTAKVSKGDSLRFGSVELKNFEVTFSNRSAQTHAGRDGNLGNGALEHSVLTLDYVNNWITVEMP
jgi:predicted aspartyl protease